MYYSLYYLIALFVASDAYKILIVFPFPSRSHANLGDGFVRHLLKAGHEITYVTTVPWNKPPLTLHQVNVSSNLNIMSNFPEITEFINRDFHLDLSLVFELCHKVNVDTLELMNELMADPTKKFDVVITEWMFSELFAGLGPLFDCPIIWSSSLDSHWMLRRLMDEITNPAYTADYSSTSIAPFTFSQRIEELWIQIKGLWMLTHTVKPLEEIAYEKIYKPAFASRGKSLPLYNEVVNNGSLMFLNSHLSFGEPNSLPANFKYIGGYHIETPIKPLPQILQKIMDDSKDGVIYFSMGSVLKSKYMSDELKQKLLKMFSELKQTVLWKFEETLPNVPKNVHILKWAPQPSILAHPNCVLFISHGGLLSTTEAIRSGVPIIGIPIFGDQFNNIERAVAKGFAKRANLRLENIHILKETIEELLNNNRYKETIKHISSLYHDRPHTPGEELVYWVEHVVRTQGALHLRPPTLLLPWYQKLYLDLAAIILISLIIMYFILTKIIILLFLNSSKDNHSKKRN